MIDENVYLRMIDGQDYIKHFWPFDKCTEKYALTT